MNKMSKHGAMLRGENPPSSTYYEQRRFGRMFGSLGAFAADTPTLRAALMRIGEKGGIIDAKDDGYTANRGSVTDQIVGDAYSENDTLGGVPFTADRITGVVTTPAAPIGGNPAVPVLDVVSGKVIVPPGTPAGEYVINYRICEKLN